MSMADDIVLMKDGYIVQQSSPRELYNNPNCVYAAQFIGTPQMNIVKRHSAGRNAGWFPSGESILKKK